MHSRLRHRNPIAGPGSSKSDNMLMWGALLAGGVAAAVGIGYFATRPAAAAAPKKVRCADGTMQTDCTGHTIPPPAVLCPDGTVQTNCAGHMTQPVQPHLPIWLPLDFTQATSIIQAGKTYRASFTGSVGGPEMTALQALLQQAGMTVTTTGPADWPDAADAADPSRVKIEAAAFASGAPPLALVPTLKMWVKT